MRWLVAAGLLAACANEAPPPGARRSALAASVALQTPDDFERRGNFESDVEVTDAGLRRATGVPSVGAWVTGPPMMQGRRGHAFFVHDGFLYAVGGCPMTVSAADNACGPPTATAEVAPLLDDGGWGPWRPSTPLPQAIEQFGWAVYDGTLYVAGGFDGTNDVAQTWWAPLQGDGGLGPYQAGPNLPQGRESPAMATWRGQLYLATGFNLQGPTNFGDVLRAEILPGGGLGPFASEGPAVSPRNSARAFTHDGRLYVWGGFAAAPVADLRAGWLGDDGHLSQWADAGTLPLALSDVAGTLVSGHLVTAGGYGGTATENFVLPVLESGRVAPAMVGTALTQPRIGAGLQSWHGRLYLSGGKGPGGVGLTAVESAPLSFGQQAGLLLFTAGAPLPVALKHAAVGGEGRQLWVTGGCDNGPVGLALCTSTVATTQLGTLDAVGNVVSWASQTPMPAPRYRHCSAVHRNHLVVVAGGPVLPDGGSAPKDTAVIFAPLLSDGGLGSWSVGADALPGGLSSPGCALVGDTLLVMGGTLTGSGYNAQVYRVPLKAGDTAGPVTSVGTLSAGRTELAATAFNGFVYATGGFISAAATTVERIQVFADGGVGAVSTVGSLNQPRATHIAGSGRGQLFVAGDGSTPNDDVEWTAVTGAGAVTGWTRLPNILPAARTRLFGTVHSGVLYAMGGEAWTNGAMLNDVQQTSIAQPAPRGEYSYTFDLGAVSQPRSVTVDATGGQGRLWLAVRFDDLQGHFGARQDLGEVTTGQSVGLPQSPARFVWVDVRFDDSDAPVDDPAFVPRTLTRLQLDFDTADAGTGGGSGAGGGAGGGGGVAVGGGAGGGAAGGGGSAGGPLSLKLGCGCQGGAVAAPCLWAAAVLLCRRRRRRVEQRHLVSP